MNAKWTIARVTQLKQMGVFEKIRGVVIGNVYPFDAEQQSDAAGNRLFFEDMFADLTKEYDFPILKIREVGHRCPSTFLPIGAEVAMDADLMSFGISESYLV